MFDDLSCAMTDLEGNALPPPPHVAYSRAPTQAPTSAPTYVGGLFPLGSGSGGPDYTSDEFVVFEMWDWLDRGGAEIECQIDRYSSVMNFVVRFDGTDQWTALETRRITGTEYLRITCTSSDVPCAAPWLESSTCAAGATTGECTIVETEYNQFTNKPTVTTYQPDGVQIILKDNDDGTCTETIIKPGGLQEPPRTLPTCEPTEKPKPKLNAAPLRGPASCFGLLVGVLGLLRL
jgi:hypothetical protein